MKTLNKKGTDKIISVYWFVILFIVSAAVVYMAAVFYGEPYDVREIEANIMINQIADCISQGGRINEGIINETFDEDFKENFLERCHLNFNVEDTEGWKEQEQYYLEVNLQKFEGKDLDSISEGNIILKDYCDKEGKNFPVWVERSFYTLDKDNSRYVIKILSIVRKTEKNAE